MTRDHWHVVGHSWGATLGLLSAPSEPGLVSSLTDAVAPPLHQRRPLYDRP